MDKMTKLEGLVLKKIRKGNDLLCKCRWYQFRRVIMITMAKVTLEGILEDISKLRQDI